jgi:hypothetical protein
MVLMEKGKEPRFISNVVENDFVISISTSISVPFISLGCQGANSN